ncbi:BlaI/MecI/CopY family transcriptional regulator [Marinicella sp. W31]|uniref:BlaI/MecI/CopY family transcriptional regulator n=1 Tax=Marinicella sp. W31 TaxID=3023713 RepID=UPI003757C570
MPDQKIKLSDLQLMIMKVLWKHRSLSVSETHSLLNQKKPMALTTVATLLKRLQEKDIINAEKQGRKLVYFPLVSESDVKNSMLGNMLQHLFNGKPAELVHHLVDNDEISEKDLNKIRQILAQEKEND